MVTSTQRDALRTLSDRELIAETRRLAERERCATVRVISALMELDARKLYLGEGCSSLFTYCTQVLHFSEHAAYGRIEGARAARRFPAVLDHLADGSLTLTAVGLLAPHLTPENHADLLSAARHKSKRDVEHLVAAVRPLAAVPSSVRKLPAARPIGTPPAPFVVLPMVAASLAAAPIRVSAKPSYEAAVAGACADATRHPAPRTGPGVVAPLAPERYKVQITISREAHDTLRRAQNLLRHVVPNGDPAAIFERALILLIEDLERKRLAAARRPRAPAAQTSGSRHVPAAVKREVWARDEGRCAFVGTAGRCTERGFLELHHVVPFADRGATDAANLQLRCCAHNVYEAEAWFGPLVGREDGAAYE